jgi:hypothetical protein
VTGPGPFASEAEATDWAREIIPREGWSASIVQANRDLLGNVLESTGVELGAYDRVVRDWLADYEPAMVAAVAGWVARSHSASFPPGMLATVVQALTDAQDFRVREIAACPDCDTAERAHGGTCDVHQAADERAARYSELAAILGAVNVIVPRSS